MSRYWKKKFNRSALEYLDSPFKQVGKTVCGIPVGPEQLDLIVAQVMEYLSLDKSSYLADLGCGNGLITRRIASQIDRVDGFDISENLIKIAQKPPSIKNSCFLCCDIINHNFSKPSRYSHVLIYEVIQHLSNIEINKLFKQIYTFSNAKTFIGSIPDAERIYDFYDTPEKKCFYEKSIANGEPHLGKWWHKGELQDLASEHNFDIEFVNQNPKLYTSYYRFDCTVTRAR